MTNNPLIAKYEELYGRKEEPKKVEYELDPEFVKELENKSTLPTDPTTKKLTSLTSYDPHSTEDSFLQVAELIKQKKGKIISMSMSVDATELFAKTISFEVMVADWDTP